MADVADALESLRSFIATSEATTRTTIDGKVSLCRRTERLSQLYLSALRQKYGEADEVPVLMLMRSHSTLLGGFRLAAGGQVPESLMLLRGCLECAAYAFHIRRHPELAEIWLRRQEGEVQRKAVEQNFSMRAIMKSVSAEAKSVGDRLRHVYEETITYGAHPNERSVTPNLGIRRLPDRIDFQFGYIQEDTVPHLWALTRVTAAGLCSLGVFSLVFPEQFGAIGAATVLAEIEATLGDKTVG